MDTSTKSFTRRDFLTTTALGLIGSQCLVHGATQDGAIPIIDIHQHTPFSGRTDEQLFHHQRINKITKTILLPAGRSNQLAAGVMPVGHTYEFVQKHPGGEFEYFSNDDVNAPGAVKEIERYLDKGAIGIGELKDKVECDSDYIIKVAELARDRGVPVLMHFQEGMYNVGFERFHRVLERFPTVKFIGHAMTFWCYVDKNFSAKDGLYPKTHITPGGLTDRWLTDYPNFYGDVSAGSGTNALLRQPDFGKSFVERHQDKLLFGSDCSCRTGVGLTCSSVEKFAMWRSLGIPEPALRKILYLNAKKMFNFNDIG